MCANENLIDHAEIFIKSGHGGSGIVHFRHEKYVNKGGPDGGDGGKGGDIIFAGNKNISTLNQFRRKRSFIAEDGKNGGRSNCHGSDANNIIIEVPVGTIVIDKDTNNVIIDITEDKQKYTVLCGGRGGLGNTHFKNSVNQTPQYAQPGEDGKEMNIILELKLLSDVGLVGLPNAGKSTLLSVISNAKPQIANYPFTTLYPQLGVVNYKECSFVVSDLPGIIEKASEGKGLGFRFLKHVERIKIIVYTIDVSTDIIETFDILRYELKKYNPELLKKKSILCFTKCDLVDNNVIEEIKRTNINLEKCFISSLQMKNISTFLDVILKNL